MEFCYAEKEVRNINSGKRFENSFKTSVPDYCLYYRLPDPPQSFNQSSSLRFSWKNPCDCFIFDSHSSIFYCLELKTTKNSSFSFEDINIEDKQPSKMIHKHQIMELLNYSKFNNICSGFIFNFRDEDSGTEETYFQEISNFIKMTVNINKKSFNKKDLIKYNPVEIIGKKKRVNYSWDINKLLSELR